MTVAKIVEITASSKDGFDAAAKLGLDRARKTLDGVRGAWIGEQKIEIGPDGVPDFRVSMKVTFIMKE